METNQAAPSPPSIQPVSIQFTAQGSDYWKIWIVNLFLNVITLGIYSPWAKVRAKRYFYQNTRIQDGSFDYHGNPIAILKGRALIVGYLLVYTLSQKIWPPAQFVVLGLYLLVFPWLLVRSFTFNFANTSFRGIRFGFQQTYGLFYKRFLGGFLLMIATLGLGFPYFLYLMSGAKLNGIRLGNKKMEFTGGPGGFYRAFGASVLVGALFGLLVAILVGAIAFAKKMMPESDDDSMLKMLIPIGFFVMYSLFIAATSAINLKIIQNHVVNHIQFEGIRFRSTLEFKPMFWLFLKNGFLTLVTLGLYWPIARVQFLAYKLSRTELLVQENTLTSFNQDASAQNSAFGDAANDFLDIDISV